MLVFFLIAPFLCIFVSCLLVLMEASEILTQNVDKTKLPPLHQKRILAFVNHFLVSSCGFLNDFSLQCETKFIELERKLQKVETALTILEAKLASIPDVEIRETHQEETPAVIMTTQPNSENEMKTELAADAAVAESQPTITQGILVADHSTYKKFFKMLQVGVPMPAVQLKMKAEGIDPSILENPQAVVPTEDETANIES